MFCHRSAILNVNSVLSRCPEPRNHHERAVLSLTTLTCYLSCTVCIYRFIFMFCNENWFVLFNPSKIYRIPESDCQKCHGSGRALSIFPCCLPSCVSDLSWAPLQSPDHLTLLLTPIQSTHLLWYNSPALAWCWHQIVSSPAVIVGVSPTDSVICSGLLRLIHLLSTTASASSMASTINPSNTGICSLSAQYSFVNKTLITFLSSLSAFGS